jgi:hypothetical protein
MKKLVLVNSSSASDKVITTQQNDIDGLTGLEHKWITVINPTNHRMLLQACDDCGVVKSENSILRLCRASKGQGLVSKSMSAEVKLVS